MRACQRVDKETFKRRDMFQVVYVSKSDKMRVLYVQGSGFAASRYDGESGVAIKREGYKELDVN